MNDTFPLEQMLETEGWQTFQECIAQKAARVQRDLETKDYDSLIDVKSDQETLRFMRKLLGKPDDVLQFLTLGR